MPAKRPTYAELSERTTALEAALSQCQNKLRNTRRRLRSLAHAKADAAKERAWRLLSFGPAIVYSSAPDGNYAASFVTENVKELLGYEARDFVETPTFWAQRIHPEDKPRVLAELPRVLEHGHHVHEYRFRDKDGRYHWMRDEARLIRDAEGRPTEILGYWIDITERREMEDKLRELNQELEQRVADRTAELEAVNAKLREEAAERKHALETLRESENRYRALFEAIPDAINVYDRESNELVDANTAFWKLHGDKDETLLEMKKQPFGLVHPDDREWIAALCDAQKGSAEPRRYPVHRRLRKDGSVFWAEVVTADIESGGRHLRLSIARDVTVRHDAQEALRRSELRYRGLVEAAPEIIFSLSPEDGTITSLNPAFAHTTGWDRSDWIGKPFLGLVHPDDRALAEEKFRLAAQGEVQAPFELRFRAESGACLIGEVVGTVRAEAERVTGIIGFVRDITERKAAEEALRESEERYRALFEQAAESIVLIDPETGALVVFNDRAHQNLGYSRREFENLRLSDIEVLESTRDVANHLQKVLRDGRDHFETKQRTKAGAVRDIEVKTRRIMLRGKPFVQGVWRDITDEKLAHAALRDSEERYRAIYEAIPHSVFVYDAETLAVLAVNDVAAAVFGYDREEFLGKPLPLATLIDPADHDRILRATELGVQSAAPIEYPIHRARTKKGEILWLDVIGTSMELGVRRCRLAIVRDVTESVQARARIEQQAMLLANVTDAITVVNRNGQIVYWNPGAHAMFGYTEAEMLETEASTVMLRNPEQRPDLDEEIDRAIRETGVWSQNRLPCRRKTGEQIWVSVRATPLRGPLEGDEGILFVARDVTEEVQLQERLIRSSRLAQIGTLALSVTHELNNLLGGLRGLAEVVPARPELVPRLLEACRAVADRGGVVASRMTTLSKADLPGEERRIDLASAVRTVVAMMEPSLAPRSIAVRQSYQEVPFTWANEGKILQVLLNLITNARDSIGRNGHIDISVRHDPGRNEILLAVHDSGAGIRGEDLPRLFEPFFTTKTEPDPVTGERGHLGLGLAESLSIAREYGGRIDVEGEPGRGATFTVRLPVRSAPTVHIPPRPAPTDLPAPGARILVVDDDELMRFSLTEQLSGDGYEAVAATNGKEALDACRAARFDYIFLDLLMPGEPSGAALFSTLRQIRPDARIIICTAYSQDSIPEDCRRTAHALLGKPFTRDDLANAFAGKSRIR